MSDPDREAHDSFRNHSYDMFRGHYYTDSENMPDIGDPNAPYGLPIAHRADLMNINQLSVVASILTVADGDYAKLARTIGTFLGRDTI